MKALIISILILFILIIFSRKLKESFEDQTNDKIKSMLNDVMGYIENAIRNRKNAGNKGTFSDEKYQKQILSLENSLKYTKYIQNNIK